MREIKVNIEKLTFGKWVIIDEVSRGKRPVKDLVNALKDVVEGGVEDLPITALNEIVEKISEAVGQKNLEGA